MSDFGSTAAAPMPAADYEFSEAALSGVRLITRKPKVLAWWMAFNAVFLTAYLTLFFWLFGGVFQSFVEVIATAVRTEGGNSDAIGQQMLQLMTQMIPRLGLAVLTLFPLLLLYSAMRRTSATRAMLYPEDDRFGYLRVGADEGRTMVVVLAIGIISFVVRILFTAGIAVVAVLLVGAQRSAGNRIGAEVLQQLLQLPMYAILVFLFLRFCLAVPHTLATKRISIFESWTLTNGRVVRLLLTYLIVFLITVLVGMVMGLVALLFVGIVGGPQLMQIIPTLQSDPATGVTRLLNLAPSLIVAGAVAGAIFTPIITALYYCPAAFIYGRLTIRKEDVF